MLAQDRVNRIKLTSKPSEQKREQRVRTEEIHMHKVVCTSMIRMRMAAICTKINAKAPCTKKYNNGVDR